MENRRFYSLSGEEEIYCNDKPPVGLDGRLYARLFSHNRTDRKTSPTQLGKTLSGL